MNLLHIFKRFAQDERGAVTVDWVVLTSAIVGLGLVVVTSVGGGVRGLSTKVVTDLGKRTVLYAAP